MKLALALTAGTAAAFVAPSSAPAAKTQLAAAPVQEWAGATAPFGFFDPLGLSKDVDAGRLAFYREAEIKHGRVAMLASVGFLFQEHYTFTGIDSPSYVSFEQPGLAGGLWLGLAVMLGNFEGKSVETFMQLDGGIVAEQNESRLFRIKEDHAWISAENNRSHAIDATASYQWRGGCVLTPAPRSSRATSASIRSASSRRMTRTSKISRPRSSTTAA
jgi:hypothetical protein